MPRAFLASRADRDSSSASPPSSTDPPEGTSTEQWQSGATAAAVASLPGSAEHQALYHARLHSYTSELDDHEDEDMQNMPAPNHMEAQTASSSPLGNEVQQHVALLSPRPSSPGKITGAGAVQTTPPPVQLLSYRAVSPPKRPLASTPGVAAAKPSVSSRALSTQTTSGYHCSTRTRVSPSPSPPQLVPASPPQPLQQRSPHGNHKRTPSVTKAAPPTMELMPPDNAYTSDAAARTSPPAPSTARWQLSSPQERERRSDDQVSGCSAVYTCASEAVSTLEQQYVDALQRLNTMHRLYDRLDAHNRTLEAEIRRIRQVQDVLRDSVTFQLYNSVRQVKHEMRLLKQYIVLLNSSFGNQLQALSQAHGEELLRLLGRHSPHTSPRPYGAEGWSQPMKTRAAIGVAGSGASSLERVAKAPSPAHSSRLANGAWASVATGMQIYSPDYWCNAASPHPRQPPSAACTHTTPVAVEDNGDAGVTDDRSGDATEDQQALSTGNLPASTESNRESDAVTEPSAGALVSGYNRRGLQAALAEAQRRVAELEQMASNRQAEYESRITQLKIAHRAKETTLKEEVALLRWRTKNAHDSGPQQIASEEGPADEPGGYMPTEFVNQLVQFLGELQRQQPTAKQQPGAPSTALRLTSALQAALRASHKTERSSLQRLEEADETPRQADCLHDDKGKPSTTANTYTRGPCHRHGTGGGSALHMPDRYSPTAAARRVERAREVLGCEEHGSGQWKQGQRVHRSSSRSRPQGGKVSAGVAAGAPTPTQHSLAYDHLINHSRLSSNRSEGRAAQNRCSAARMQPCTARDMNSCMVPQCTSSSRWQSSGRAVKGARRDVTADPKLPRSRLADVDIDVARVAQGMWAQELLEERNYL
ncbi:hypothetical protein JKF63_04605 [Porcisia hertigi]|uniref:Uncharacterized protein n=1 Tax=Porcisia hertigi TaxID=2761500 RepID=A0A836L8E7_9TRYP|nr:hypothetical protein JKF63_04605 [Porcisia hertigi]